MAPHIDTRDLPLILPPFFFSGPLCPPFAKNHFPFACLFLRLWRCAFGVAFGFPPFLFPKVPRLSFPTLATSPELPRPLSRSPRGSMRFFFKFTPSPGAWDLPLQAAPRSRKYGCLSAQTSYLVPCLVLFSFRKNELSSLAKRDVISVSCFF